MTTENGDSAARAAATAPLAELESLIGEMTQRVTALRGADLDAAALRQRLLELNELATRASDALDRASR